MKKIFVFLLAPLVFFFPGQSLASQATAVVESQVEVGEGDSQVYQSIETTVNGQTVKKESTQPGKLELKMEKVGDEEATVSFSQEPAISPPSTAESVTLEVEEKVQEESEPPSIFERITNFLQQFFGKIFGIF